MYGSYEPDFLLLFDNIDHEKLVEMLEERIDDRPLIRLIKKWLKVGILDTDGKVIHPVTGTPQGGIVSPTLTNVYLHYGVVDNYASLNQFFWQAMRILFKWLNRRSQRRSFNWQGFQELLKHFRVEQPRIVGRPKTRKAASLA